MRKEMKYKNNFEVFKTELITSNRYISDNSLKKKGKRKHGYETMNRRGILGWIWIRTKN